MKKIINIWIVLMLMFSISALALADEADNNSEEVSDAVNEDTQDLDNETEQNETEIDSDTQEQIKIMNNSIGAEIRLLQLEKAILKNIVKGEKAIDVLKGLDYNTTDLEVIIEEMKLLLKEVNNSNASDEDAVQQFVDLKSDARELTKEYSDKIKELLSDAKIREIKEMIKNQTSGQLENCSKKIRNKIKQFNRNQIHNLYGLIGEKNETILEQYQNGNMTIKQVKNNISKKINMMIKEKKQQVFKELKKEKIKRQHQVNMTSCNLSQNFSERRQERLQNRLNNALQQNNNNLSNQIKNNIQEKIQNNIPDEGQGKGKGK